jgi:uncharacterized circularly permuted ATP-grasp superfamily protein
MATSARRAPLPKGAADYPIEGCFDEAMAAPGVPRPGHEAVLEALGERDLATLADEVQRGTATLGVTFGPDAPVAVDPVPRLIDAAEWDALEPGLLQRAQALNAFLLDAYGERRIFSAQVVPAALLETSPGYEPRMRGLLDPARPPATVAGFDLVRDESGGMMVLEDNLRMPSGASYASAIRHVVAPALDAGGSPRRLDCYFEALAAALRGAAPDGRGDPSIAIVSEGPAGGAWFEHRGLAGSLGVPVALPDDLETSQGRLYARSGRARRQVDVVYRRLDRDRLTDERGEPTKLGEIFLPPLESGRLGVVNAFGTGLADDKLAHAYVGEMIRFYLDQEPILPAVPTIDLSDAAQRRDAMARIDDLVVKPRNEFGGHGVTIMAAASEVEQRETVGLLRREADRFVAQEPVAISTHPTVCDGRLRPRRVDLRPFVITARDRATAMPGGLTRFARGPGNLVVNSSRGGGCKDTWVVDR